jgi:uncharacterized protein YdbL (DUF1318 family)
MKKFFDQLKLQIIALLKSYLATEGLKKLATAFLQKALGLGGGLWGFAIGILVKLGIKTAKKAVIKEEVKAINAVKKEKFNEVAEKPDVKSDEFEKAVDDYLGGGFQ